MISVAYISLGTNLGNKAENICLAISEFELLVNQGVFASFSISSVYETEPWGVENQDPYWNAVFEVWTTMTSNELLEALHAIEIKAGRVRNLKWEARVLDLDILFYNNEVIISPSLTIPHPLLTQRRFVLEPLMQLSSSFIHPLLNATISELYAICPDHSKATQIDNTLIGTQISKYEKKAKL